MRLILTHSILAFKIMPTYKARCKRDLVLEDAMTFMGWSVSNKTELGRMLRGFKVKTPTQIYDNLGKAKHGNKPRGLFLYLMGMVKTNNTH